MIETRQFLVDARIDAEALEAWIKAGWLRPVEEQTGVREFSEVDLARAQLIHDLRDDLGVNVEGITVVLDLIDQLHALRRTVRGLLLSLHAQPETTRRQIFAHMREAASRDPSNKASSVPWTNWNEGSPP